MTPASFTVRYTMRGYPCELRLEDEDTSELMKRADNALLWLEKNGATGTPEPTPAAVSEQATARTLADDLAGRAK